ncbi:MAG: 2-oxoglutarate dehydrogenase complex dihydrolipoyllysine-residue succinyltransferase [Myxococcaceae bacterium]
MGVELTVPQLGESISEAVVGKWHKKVGETVSADEPLVVLETDKVTIDVPAPAGGSLENISRKEGDRVKVGEVLGSILAGAKGAAGTTAVSATPPALMATPLPSTTPLKASPSGPPPSNAESSRAAHATPVASRLMEDKGLDPKKIQGTGPGGKIYKQDVLGAMDSGPVRAPVALPGPAATSGLALPRTKAEREERVKMTPLRRRVAERLLQAQSTAAILTTFNEADMGAVMALRKQHAERFEKKHGVKLGFMSFFVRAAIEALKAFPMVNAEIEGEDVVFKHYYDIGVAVSGSRGLVVPVLRDADRLSMAEIEKQISELALKARNDKLALTDLQGGTFTISNGGIFGSMMSTPILNPPQVGILGLHNITERAVVRDGAVVARPMMYLALSYDHRLIDGREAVQFLVRIKDCIEDPQRLLLEV